jgi:hypothetical protein
MPIYQLCVEPISVSKAKLLKFFNTKSFYAHRPLEISFRFENIGEEPFPGCIFSWHIAWPSGQAVYASCEVPALQRGENRQSKPYRTDALSEGFGLIFLTNFPSVPNGSTVLHVGNREYRKREDIIESFGSVLAKRTQELYTFYGLMISAIGLLVTALDKIIALVRWFLKL